MGDSRRNLLIVAHFSPTVGYAWETIGEYFVALGEWCRSRGRRALVVYPEVNEIPERFSRAGLEVIRFDFGKERLAAIYRLVRENDIGIVYLTDRPFFSVAYAVCRLAGAERVVVHDRASGLPPRPPLWKRMIKRLINWRPGVSADLVIAISGFVRRRTVEVGCFPAERTVRIWNGVDIEKFCPGEDDYVYRTYGIPRDRTIVFASSRANRYKGIEVLIDAAEILVKEKGDDKRFFLYCGDGPDLERFRDRVREKGLQDVFLCPGRTRETARILKGVSVVVVPSLWQEGFGLSVVEGMASGKVVIASAVGGIPEIIADGVDGFLVPAGDSRALARRLESSTAAESRGQFIAAAARRSAEEKFDLGRKRIELVTAIQHPSHDKERVRE